MKEELLGDGTPLYYYAQMEAVIGLGPSIRLGFNPGEVLDFVLGWFTIDIFNDDLEWRKRRETTSPAED